MSPWASTSECAPFGRQLGCHSVQSRAICSLSSRIASSRRCAADAAFSSSVLLCFSCLAPSAAAASSAFSLASSSGVGGWLKRREGSETNGALLPSLYETITWTVPWRAVPGVTCCTTTRRTLPVRSTWNGSSPCRKPPGAASAAGAAAGAFATSPEPCDFRRPNDSFCVSWRRADGGGASAGAPARGVPLVRGVPGPAAIAFVKRRPSVDIEARRSSSAFRAASASAARAASSAAAFAFAAASASAFAFAAAAAAAASRRSMSSRRAAIRRARACTCVAPRRLACSTLRSSPESTCALRKTFVWPHAHSSPPTPSSFRIASHRAFSPVPSTGSPPVFWCGFNGFRAS